MNHILVIGAGRSATTLIHYLLKQAEQHEWIVTVVDADPDLATQKIGGHPNGRSQGIDILNEKDRKILVDSANVVVSMLPAHLHHIVAHDCLQLGKHLATASYVSPELYDFDEAVRERNLIFMGELGLDPGIDHMSAMQKIHEIQDKGGELTKFRSYTGGLIAPESDDNPWHYKFTWNPRNVVLAGQGTARFLEGGKYKYIPYNQLFRRYRPVDIPDLGLYEAYANRDSLKYRELYGLEEIPTILRGTIRAKGFCDAWNALVQLGLTDDSFLLQEPESMTYKDLLEAIVPGSPGTVFDQVARFLGENPDSEVMSKLKWLGLFEDQPIPLEKGSPAKALEYLLLEKWKLEPEDKDMIVMQHEFEYKLGDQLYYEQSSLVMKGENFADTAMARLVGLPLGIFVKLVMLGRINVRGVGIPVMPEVYEPVLEELKEYQVVFREKEILLENT